MFSHFGKSGRPRSSGAPTDAAREFVARLGRKARREKDVIRRALEELEKSRLATRNFIRQLRSRFGDEGVLSVRLDDRFEAVGHIDGERHDDLYLPTRAVRFEFSGGAEDFVEVYLGSPDPSSPVRLLLGVLPLQSQAVITVEMAELDVDMKPRAVAYWTNS